jgi:hypothetical protein
MFDLTRYSQPVSIYIAKKVGDNERCIDNAKT